VLADTMVAVRLVEAREDRRQVARMLDAWRARGLAVAGAAATLHALETRQVEQLLIAARPDSLALFGQTSPEDRVRLAEMLVAKAQQNSARVRFVEDAELLREVGGVGALLRFRI
jgi:peptide subunit release factor 1 (eRF1)